ncbi:MAG: trypsin-like peptidase domain-containing protein [Mariprofundaceae bacterium]|nr:trypsin-like peptidase domain-containing protein [Mariprofundaceae bacterium]
MKFLSQYLKQLPTALALFGISSASVAQAEPTYEPILDYHASSIFAQVGAPVGRLHIQTSAGNFYCTGFLISENHLITNRHCLAKIRYDKKQKKNIPQMIKKVTLELGYIDPANKTASTRYKVKLPALETNEALDYAILEVENDPASEFGYLSISTNVIKEKSPLWIIGHPRGKAQQISRIHCKSILPARSIPNRIQHTCPAMSGSSGSPVFDASTGQVIAVHHASIKGVKPKIGLAVPFSEIIKQSMLLRKILKTR